MKKKFYIKPESIVVCSVEATMGRPSTGTDESFAKRNNMFFKDNEEDYNGDMWSDFVPFEGEE